MSETTNEPTNGDDERAEYVDERENSDGTAEPSDDSERTVGRRPGDETDADADTDDMPEDEPDKQPDSDTDAEPYKKPEDGGDEVDTR